MHPAITSLFQAATGNVGGEEFDILLQTPKLRLERILSHGHASPPGFWYDQAEAEWVALLRGAAELEFEDGLLPLKAGDALLIPAHCRHRVASCSADALWLALHVTDEATS